MATNTLEARARRPKLAWMATAVCCLFGMAAIAGWSLPEADPAVHRAEVATSLSDGGVLGTAGERPIPVPATRDARSKVNCDGCGVIESMRSIDTRVEGMKWCAIGDTAGARFPGNLIDGDGHSDLAPLADTVAGVIVGDHPARKVRVTTRHQIVVRFRDGSRHVFDEDTPRAWREGDRIRVIAGSARLNG